MDEEGIPEVLNKYLTLDFNKKIILGGCNSDSRRLKTNKEELLEKPAVLKVDKSFGPNEIPGRIPRKMREKITMEIYIETWSPTAKKLR